MTAFRFATKHPVRWVDIDIQGVVNNAVYLSLMEHARFEYFTELGVLNGAEVKGAEVKGAEVKGAEVKGAEVKGAEVNGTEVRGADVPFTLGDVHVRYLSPGRPGMTLTVRARTVRLGNKSFDMAYEIACGETLLATGEAVLVWIGDGQTVSIPPAARTAIAAFEGIAEQS